MITQYENSTLLPSASAQNTLCEIRQKALQLKLLLLTMGVVVLFINSLPLRRVDKIMIQKFSL